MEEIGSITNVVDRQEAIKKFAELNNRPYSGVYSTVFSLLSKKKAPAIVDRTINTGRGPIKEYSNAERQALAFISTIDNMGKRRKALKKFCRDYKRTYDGAYAMMNNIKKGHVKVEHPETFAHLVTPPAPRTTRTNKPLSTNGVNFTLEGSVVKVEGFKTVVLDKENNTLLFHF
jgi:hypothetical protein